MMNPLPMSRSRFTGKDDYRIASGKRKSHRTPLSHNKYQRVKKRQLRDRNRNFDRRLKNAMIRNCPYEKKIQKDVKQGARCSVEDKNENLLTIQFRAIPAIVMEINSWKNFMLFFYRVVFSRSFTIYPDMRAYPHLHVFPHRERNDWWSWMEQEYNAFDERCMTDIPNMSHQIKNILEFTAVIRKPWNGETKIVIGCGHKFVHDHRGAYTVDPDPQMGSDCLINFGNFSLARAIPEAKGKIKMIIMEGIMIPENPCFHQDILELLDETGVVCQDICHEIEPVLMKKDGEMFVVKYKPSPCYVYRNNPRETLSLVPYKPWVIETLGTGPRLLDLGSDALNWKRQIAKVKSEDEYGVWDNVSDNPKTPFDPMFGK